MYLQLKKNGLCPKSVSALRSDPAAHPGGIRCPSQPLKSYNRSHMQLASSARIPDGILAAMRHGSEKPHQGLSSRNPALYQGPTVCNSTTALGLRGQAELNRVGSCSTGKERDAESGNDYFGARYYASSMGRFMSPDWSAKVEPVPYSKLDDPQTLNLYAYVMNNPVTSIDADGHAPLSWGGFSSCGEEYAAVGCGAGSQTAGDMAQNSAFNAQQAAQGQNAASSGSTGGTPFKPIQAGGTTVTGTFDPFGDIGVTIHATPSNCGDCQWVQQAVELGGGDHSWDYGHKAFIDGQDVMGNVPLMPKGGCGSNCLDDQPARPSGPYPSAFSAVAVFGHADEANRTFRALGAITYGFSISSHGALTPHGPVAASASQMSGVIKQAAHMSMSIYSGWSIR